MIKSKATGWLYCWKEKVRNGFVNVNYLRRISVSYFAELTVLFHSDQVLELFKFINYTISSIIKIYVLLLR